MLYLLRHGETEENVRHILQGQTHGTLTALGRQQAAEAARELMDVPFDVMLCSDLKRCVDTANIIRDTWATLGRTILPTLSLTPLLRERDWGSATGMVVDKDHRITIPPDVESIKAVKERARIFLDFVARTYAGKNVLAVSHGFFCRIIQTVYHNVEIPDIQPMKNSEVRMLDLSES